MQLAADADKFPVVHKVFSFESLNVTTPVAPFVTPAVKVTGLWNSGDEVENV